MSHTIDSPTKSAQLDRSQLTERLRDIQDGIVFIASLGWPPEKIAKAFAVPEPDVRRTLRDHAPSLIPVRQTQFF